MLTIWLSDTTSGFPVCAFYYFLSTLSVISPRPLEAPINRDLSPGTMEVGPYFCFGLVGSGRNTEWVFGCFFFNLSIFLQTGLQDGAVCAQPFPISTILGKYLKL